VLALINPYWDSILTTAGITAVIVTGLYFSNSAGALSVAHAAIAGVGGYVGGILTTNHGWSFELALVAGGVAGALTGTFLAVISLHMNELVAGLTTLAFGQTMVVIAFNIDYIGGANSFYGIPPHTTLRGVLIAVAALLFVGWQYDRSRLGIAARAIRDDRLAASAMGINVARVKISVFALGAAVAGVGGVLLAHYVLVVSPGNLGFYESLNYVIIWVFGGSYLFLGPIFGAFALTALPEGLRFSAEQRFMVYGLLLTVVILLRPKGVITRIPPGRYRRSWVRRRVKHAAVAPDGVAPDTETTRLARPRSAPSDAKD
jgi:branched-chain amino acid transport system permease protein